MKTWGLGGLLALLLLGGWWLLSPSGELPSRSAAQRPTSTDSRAAVAPIPVTPNAAEPGQVVAVASAVPVRLPIRPEQLTTALPLDELLDAAERSADVEERVLAAMAGSACMTQQSHLADRAKGEVSESLAIEIATQDQPQHRALFTQQYLAAQAELTRYCAGARRWTEGSMLRDRLRLSGSVSALARWRPQDPVGRQRHDQAVLQVLANPRQYSAGLDGWLRQVMPTALPQVQGLSPAQRHSLEDLLHARLSGAPPDPHSIRSLTRCAHQRICPAVLQLDAAAQQRVEALADELERLIRQQRWAELFPPAR